MQTVEKSIIDFFHVWENYEILTSLVRNKKLQPRILDFYICQYSKTSPQLFQVKVEGEYCGLSDVYSSYKLQLKGYHKRWFNLFSKGKVVRLAHEGEVIEMALARANVYKWLIISEVFEMILTQLPDIHSEYSKHRKKILKNKKANVAKRGKMKSFLKNPLLVMRL